MKYIIFLIFLIFLIFIYNININIKTVERFCKLPNLDNQGDINNKNVLLNYLPQSDIYTSSCDQYWKDWPLEYNNTLIDDEPNIINSEQLKLPKEKQFADNNYTAGLIDFDKLANIISDKIDYDIFTKSNELLIDPITNEKLDYEYELKYFYIKHNKKTWINRWEQYNPSIKNKFIYSEIKSPIKAINILNLEFSIRCNIRQKQLLTNNQLILFGLIPFDIFKYKILNINYLNNNINNPIYIIQISLYRESDLYINTFSYIGMINNDKISIINVKYIGRNSTDTVLLSNYYNPKEIKQEIINKNFSNASEINKDPSAIVHITKKQSDSYKLNNQYACYSIDDNSVLLPYFSRETCESQYDNYGKKKSVGIYDTPCKKDDDCPFYKVNKNYDNNYGKCMSDGYCELPINMERIGYKYFKNNPNNKSLCYNCKSDKFTSNTTLNTCCDNQFDKTKYPFLKSPDYAFKGDELIRKNYFDSKFCTFKNNSDIICKDIIL